MLDHTNFMRELVSILRGEHPGWEGDRIYNAEFFLRTLAMDFPHHAAELVAGLRANVQDYSDFLGISPNSVSWVANRIDEAVRKK